MDVHIKSYKLGGTTQETIKQDFELLDEITNYDELVFVYGSSTRQAEIQKHFEQRITVDSIIYNETDTYIDNGSATDLSVITRTNTHLLTFYFKNNKKISIRSTMSEANLSGTWYFSITAIKGVKY